MKEKQMPLAKAFSLRPDRFRMLIKGIKETGWENKKINILEVGCSKGDAAAYLAENYDFNIYAVDISENLIYQAIEEHQKIIQNKNLSYMCENAEKLSFTNGIFRGIYSEAAFSPLPNKRKVINEYSRLLNFGGKVLINDFVIKNTAAEKERNEMVHIPCFAGVRTKECYVDMFEEAGFRCIYFKEDYSELIRTAVWLCKIYKVSAVEISSYLSKYFCIGKSQYVQCSGKSPKGSFFKKADLTYAQMIFEKK